MAVPELYSIQTLPQTREAFSCYYSFSRLLDYIHAGVRTTFPEDYQLHLGHTGKAAALASCGFSAPQV